MKRFSLHIALFVVVVVVIEVCSFLVILIAERTASLRYTPISNRSLSSAHQKQLQKLLDGKLEYIDYDSLMGWTIKSNGRSAKFKVNSQGIRGNKEYKKLPPDGIVRIASFGDSFTHGDEAKNEETWQYIMEGIGSEYNIEALNFGVPGYGLDQAFLRYKYEGISYNSDIVLIGFMSENIERSVNVFPPFYVPGAAIPLTKPRYTILNDTLKLIPNPIKNRRQYSTLIEDPESILTNISISDYRFNNPLTYKSGTEDFSSFIKLVKMTYFSIMWKLRPHPHFYYYENPTLEPFQVSMKVIDTFYKQVKTDEKLPIIIMFPNIKDIKHYDHSGRKSYQTMLSHFDSLQYDYIDLLDKFKGITNNQIEASIVMPGGHYTPESNRLVASYILEKLKDKNILKNIE